MDVVRAIRGFMESEEHIRQVNHTQVTLISTVKELKTMQQLRPISMCNVIYKLGSKVLSNRLKRLLQDGIAPNQSAFVPGRRQGYGVLKLDMSKAYDRVEWLFLESVNVSMGFDMRWVNWIMNCVKSISYSFILNGEPRGRLIRSRGVRQGDYLTRYVSIMCGGAVLDVGEGRVKMSVSWCGYCSQCPIN
ncbi:hypothetical protein ACLB2K_037566 [Fragaria x ananassa]